jgi:hypothetical protein
MARAHASGGAAQRLFVDSDRGSMSPMAIGVVEDNGDRLRVAEIQCDGTEVGWCNTQKKFKFDKKRLRS